MVFFKLDNFYMVVVVDYLKYFYYYGFLEGVE